MSRAGFYALAGLLTACFVSSTWLMLARAFDVIDVEETTCAAWMARPREGVFRLRDCAVDTTRATALEHDDTHTSVLRAQVQVGQGTLGELTAETDHPEVLAWVRRLEASPSDAARSRARERWGDALTVTAPLEGRVFFYEDSEYGGYLLRPHRPQPFAPALGTVVSVLCLAGLFLLVRGQRRWSRRAAAIRRAQQGSSEPIVF